MIEYFMYPIRYMHLLPLAGFAISLFGVPMGLSVLGTVLLHPMSGRAGFEG